MTFLGGLRRLYRLRDSHISHDNFDRLTVQNSWRDITNRIPVEKPESPIKHWKGIALVILVYANVTFIVRATAVLQ